ncbi:TraK family protein [Geomonas azotofigens]|uniref:TraK family protein n=1 Tax=Geomonas azotofigens TaxID=2843196 RepID=UPI001C11D102|nr:TraK family protein [Geomonas azotofigens]MBU5613529.1 TraK family protein [Geomonas azotofigens]
MKTLSERIAARAVDNKPMTSNKKKNRAVFLTLRPDIIQALNDGWPVREIWETLHEEGKVAFGYSAFCGYTNRLILAQSSRHQEPPVNELSEAHKPANTGKKAPETKDTPKTSGFTFNPSPKKEDLI